MTLKQIFNTSAELDYPTVLPTLDLDFANTKTLDPRITFTRASSGSYFGADGILKYAGVNEARFDHNPVTGESLGLLIEEPRANLLIGSEDIENSTDWGRANCGISTNITTAPNGTLTAEKIVDDNTINQRWVRRRVFGVATNTLVTASIFFKFDSTNLSARGFSLAVTDAETGGSSYSSINVKVDGSFTLPTPNFPNTTGGLVALPNGWYRSHVTFTNGSVSQLSIRLQPVADSNGAAVYQGDGSSGVFVWGAQLEVGAFPTSYIPTTTSSRTRAADNAQITGTNFSSWYRQDEGTVSIGCITRRPAGTNSADFAITNSFTTTYTSRIVGWFNIGPSPFISVFANNINIFLPYVGTPTNSTNIPIKKAIALATRNMRVATNGTIITGNLGNTTVPNYLPNDFNRLLIGYEGLFAGYLNGTISRLTYYPKALPNSQLITLTAV